VDPEEIEAVIQRARLELYRDNLSGALEILERGRDGRADDRLAQEMQGIRSCLAHLGSRDAYARAYEDYYRERKARPGLKLLEREIRTLFGRRTRRMVRRYADYPEFRLLEREVLVLGATRVLDAGCGEGRVALTLGARHPGLRIEGVEVTETNVRIARRLNRFPNIAFHRGFIEDAAQLLPPGSFDLAYSFAVLEHVPDVDATVGAIFAMLRPGGRLCVIVPMNEFSVTGPLPAYVPPDGIAGHVRVFTEADLEKRFGRFPGFVVMRLPGAWRSGRYPDAIRPKEFGAYFAAFSRP
jgi:2-polyprenyl-3-methyl-5-hydroxy-6-metoxy-1,4-benzoquinol methylase